VCVCVCARAHVRARIRVFRQLLDSMRLTCQWQVAIHCLAEVKSFIGFGRVLEHLPHVFVVRTECAAMLRCTKTFAHARM